MKINIIAMVAISLVTSIGSAVGGHYADGENGWSPGDEYHKPRIEYLIDGEVKYLSLIRMEYWDGTRPICDSDSSINVMGYGSHIDSDSATAGFYKEKVYIYSHRSNCMKPVMTLSEFRQALENEARMIKDRMELLLSNIAHLHQSSPTLKDRLDSDYFYWRSKLVEGLKMSLGGEVDSHTYTWMGESDAFPFESEVDEIINSIDWDVYSKFVRLHTISHVAYGYHQMDELKDLYVKSLNYLPSQREWKNLRAQAVQIWKRQNYAEVWKMRDPLPIYIEDIELFQKHFDLDIPK